LLFWELVYINFNKTASKQKGKELFEDQHNFEFYEQPDVASEIKDHMKKNKRKKETHILRHHG